MIYKVFFYSKSSDIPEKIRQKSRTRRRRKTIGNRYAFQANPKRISQALVNSIIVSDFPLRSVTIILITKCSMKRRFICFGLCTF